MDVMTCTGLYTVRTADVGDAAAIADIWNPIISDTPFTFTDSRKTPENIAKDIEDKNFDVSIIELKRSNPNTPVKSKRNSPTRQRIIAIKPLSKHLPETQSL